MKWVPNIGIELTRKCSMFCGHCLRGPMQNIDIDEEHLRSLLGQGLAIDNLLLTGGEPTLNVSGMELIADGLNMTRTTIESLYMVTNGLTFTKRVCTAFDRILWHADQSSELNGITVSQDKYHDSVRIPDRLESHPAFIGYNKLGRMLRVGNWSGVHDAAQEENSHIPLAKDVLTNRLGCMSCPSLTLYLNVHGWVMTSVDMSYKQQDELDQYRLCHVDDLSDVLERHSEKYYDLFEQEEYEETEMLNHG